MIPWLAVTTRCFYTREPFIQKGAVAEWYKALHLYDKINEDPNFQCLPPAWAIFKKKIRRLFYVSLYRPDDQDDTEPFLFQVHFI